MHVFPTDRRGAEASAPRLPEASGAAAAPGRQTPILGPLPQNRRGGRGGASLGGHVDRGRRRRSKIACDLDNGARHF